MDSEEFSVPGQGWAGSPDRMQGAEESGRSGGIEAGDGHGAAQVRGKEAGSRRDGAAQAGKVKPSGMQALGKDFGEGMEQPQPPLRAGSRRDEEGESSGSSRSWDSRERVCEKLRGLGENMEWWEGKSTAELAARLAQRIAGTPTSCYPAGPGIHQEPGMLREPGMLQEPGMRQEPEDDQDAGIPAETFEEFLGMLRAAGNAESSDSDSDGEQQPVVVAFVQQSPRARALAREFQDVWARGHLDCGRLGQEELLDGEPVPFQPECPRPRGEERRMERLLWEYLDREIVERGTSSSNNPWILVPKPEGRGWRLSLQCSALNAATPVGPPERPRREAILASISDRSRFFSVLDLCSACLAIPLARGCRGRFAFTFRGQQFLFTRLPPTFRGTSSILQRRVATMLARLEPDAAAGVFHYYDDILITGQSRKQVKRRTRQVLRLIRETGFKANPAKAQLVQSEVNYLGFTIGAKGCSIPREKVEEICAELEAPGPWDPTRLRSVLGKIGAFKNFIADHSELALPLQQLARRRSWGWRWEQEQRQQLQRLRRALEDAPVLGFPVKSRPFVVRISVHAETAGAVLLQEREGALRPVWHSSHRLRGQNLSPQEAWCLAALEAIQEFQSFTGPAPIIIQNPNGNFLLRGVESGGCWRPEEWTLLVAPAGPVLPQSQGISIGLAPPLGDLPDGFPKANVWFLAVERGRCRETSIGFGLASLQGRKMTAVSGRSSVPEVELEALRELLEQHGSRSPLLLYCNRPGLAARLQRLEQGWHVGGDARAIVLRWLRAFPGMLSIREVGAAADPLEREQLEAVSSSVRVLPDITRSSWILWEPSRYETQEVVAWCHRGHGGVQSTEDRMEQAGFYGGGKRDLTRWVRSCPTCRERNPEADGDSGSDAGSEAEAAQRAQGPWSRLLLSLSPALPATAEGFQALLVAQDALSGWLDAFPLRRRGEPELRQALLHEVFGRLGKVQSIVLAPAPAWLWDSLQQPPLRAFWNRLERSELPPAAAAVLRAAQAAGKRWAEALPLIVATGRCRWVAEGELQPLLCVPDLPLEVCWESPEPIAQGSEESELARLRRMRLRPRSCHPVRATLWHSPPRPGTYILGARNWGVPDPGSKYARSPCSIRWLQDLNTPEGRLQVHQIRRQGALDLGSGYRDFGMPLFQWHVEAGIGA